MTRAGRRFDGEEPDPASVERHVAACPVCRTHLAQLQTMHDGARTAFHREELSDAQLPLFLEGLRHALEYPPARTRPRRSLWAVVSLATAALLVAASAFVILHSGPQPVKATVVESMSTEFVGASVTTYGADSDVTTVWITNAPDDIL